MKCPKCGDMNFAETPACKRCGFPLEHTAKNEDATFRRSVSAPSPIRLDAVPNPAAAEEQLASGSIGNASGKLRSRAGELQSADPLPRRGASPGRTSKPEERFHSLAGRLDDERGTNLRLDFGATRRDSDSPSRASGETEALLDRAFEQESARRWRAGLEPAASRPMLPDEGRTAPSLPPDRGGTNPAMRDTARDRLSQRPAELGWISAGLGPERDAGCVEFATAAIGPRFLAGVIDAVLLLAVAGLFLVAFVVAGGKFEAKPLDWGVALFIAVFWIFFYFSLFTLFAFRTPGQSAMRLTVRTLDGDPPAPSEALLRGFGYVVSVATLMLGFLWAAMDSDGMAWHDHISGTVLVEQDGSQAPFRQA